MPVEEKGMCLRAQSMSRRKLYIYFKKWREQTTGLCRRGIIALSLLVLVRRDGLLPQKHQKTSTWQTSVSQTRASPPQCAIVYLENVLKKSKMTFESPKMFNLHRHKTEKNVTFEKAAPKCLPLLTLNIPFLRI